ncbi:MAG: efflux RND transporter periplasmic adaptor subunit [Chitinispirillaceae bacterium]|jgi:membrane fusion protein, multidrug efflux system
MKVPGKRVVFAVAAFATCAALCAVTGGCRGKGQPAARSASATADSAGITVVVAEVHEQPFEDWGSYSAELRGIEDATLTAPAQGGRVNWLKEVGTRCRTGDTLCGIDGERYEAAFEAAKAQVDVTNGDLERAKVNVEKGWVGPDALDAANLAYQNARVALAAARRMLDDAECRAPFDGIITSRNIERFQTVVPGTPTIRVSRIDQLQAIIAIPEAEAFSYAPGMKTEFCLLQHPEKVHAGRLASLDLAVDSQSRTVAARIVVPNRDGSLRPGMVGRASILRHRYDKAIVIPSTALVRLQNGIAAMVVENGIARQRIIRVGATSGDSTMIAGGLSQGDTLIVTGAFQVSDGTRVRY